MYLTIFKILLSQKEVKIILSGTATGRVLQIICNRYLKSHPELLDENYGNSKKVELAIKNKNRKPRFRRFFTRGNAIVKISGISIKIIEQVVIKFLAKKRLFAGLSTSSYTAFNNIK